jgi:hypothetical protein
VLYTQSMSSGFIRFHSIVFSHAEKPYLVAYLNVQILWHLFPPIKNPAWNSKCTVVCIQPYSPQGFPNSPRPGRHPRKEASPSTQNRTPHKPSNGTAATSAQQQKTCESLADGRVTWIE